MSEHTHTFQSPDLFFVSGRSNKLITNVHKGVIYVENIFILSRDEINMTFSRTSDFADLNTTIAY